MRLSKRWLVIVTIPVLLGNPLRLESNPDDVTSCLTIEQVPVWYCSNAHIKQTIEATLSNPSLSQNVDEIQSYLESSLLPYFAENPGKWLVSVSKFHRVSGYADDAAKSLNTFCAMNDNALDIHVVIVKVE
ncbi:hypothetical protein ANCCAN_00462 [Ancylostoma caninum]|uniref:Uncharacterized protein n=1 Tax=Ancylostoma caninum TaxID=29170 RepID=A0A368HDH8_ANCCA|nr:hypothetical protein ANCCAN_00462 [Ancylostoma caninum]